MDFSRSVGDERNGPSFDKWVIERLEQQLAQAKADARREAFREAAALAECVADLVQIGVVHSEYERVRKSILRLHAETLRREAEKQ